MEPVKFTESANSTFWNRELAAPALPKVAGCPLTPSNRVTCDPLGWKFEVEPTFWVKPPCRRSIPPVRSPAPVVPPFTVKSLPTSRVSPVFCITRRPPCVTVPPIRRVLPFRFRTPVLLITRLLSALNGLVRVQALNAVTFRGRESGYTVGSWPQRVVLTCHVAYDVTRPPPMLAVRPMPVTVPALAVTIPIAVKVELRVVPLAEPNSTFWNRLCALAGLPKVTVCTPAPRNRTVCVPLGAKLVVEPTVWVKLPRSTSTPLDMAPVPVVPLEIVKFPPTSI